MEIIKELEAEAAKALRDNGGIVRACAAENVLEAIAGGLIALAGNTKAERYVIEQSLAAGRIVTQNLGVAPEFLGVPA